MSKRNIPKVLFSEFQKNIKTGDIFAWGDKGLISTAIRFATRSSISHVGIFVWLEGMLFVCDATYKHKVSYHYAEPYFKNYLENGGGKIYWGRPRNQFYSEDEIKQRIKPTLGKSYDSWNSPRSFIFRSKKDDRYYCSEWEADISGTDEFYLLSKRGILPLDTVNKCENQIRQLIFS